MMRCPNCQAQLDEDTIYCGNCGQQVAPFQARGATASYVTERHDAGGSFMTQRTAPMLQGPPAPSHKNTPPPQGPSPARRRRRPGLLAIAILLLVLLAGGTVLALTLLKNNPLGGIAANASGQVTFFDGPNGTGSTDALKIVVSGLSAPAAGSQYDAWLVDETGEHTTPLGTLSAQGNLFSLSFVGGSEQPGTNLLGSGNVVEITLEQGKVQLPTGKVLLSATFPPKAFVHIKHLLFSFPTTPAKIGLLVGLLNQTRLLNAQALALQSLASNGNAAAITCIAQSIIDISEGQQGSHFQQPPASCGSSIPTGDGFGILGTNGYATTAATHASLAATQSDSTANIRLHAGEVEAGTTNITGWVTTIDHDALQLLSNPGDIKSIQEIVALANHAFQGVDANGNGQVDPGKGEAGAATAYLRGQLMANLTLTPRP